MKLCNLKIALQSKKSVISCYLFAVVQQHDVIISQVVLTEV